MVAKRAAAVGDVSSASNRSSDGTNAGVLKVENIGGRCMEIGPGARGNHRATGSPIGFSLHSYLQLETDGL